MQLRIVQCHVELIVQYFDASLLELKTNGLSLKFHQPSEVTLNDVSGKLSST